MPSFAQDLPAADMDAQQQHLKTPFGSEKTAVLIVYLE